MKRVLFCVLGALIAFSARPVHAQVHNLTLIYTPGWNMVGGPVGGEMAGAEAIYRYSASGYVPAGETVSDACQGYWAYFAIPTPSWVTPEQSQSGSLSVQCSLQTGWNLINNPFRTPAQLPLGTTGYHWNGVAYDTVPQVPIGGSVWVYVDAASTMTLTTF
jgi:hypothetical protein